MRKISSGWSGLFFPIALAAVALNACSRAGSEVPPSHDAAASGGNPGMGGASPTGGMATSRRLA